MNTFLAEAETEPARQQFETHDEERNKQIFRDVKRRQGWSKQEIERVWSSQNRCDRCRLCLDPDTGYVKVNSRGSGPIMVVGEAPGYEESKAGEAFVGPAARHGERIITEAGIPLDFIRWTNTTRCFPQNGLSPRTPDFENETVYCVDYLWDEIEEVKPKVIVSLGSYSTKVLLGLHEVPGISKIAGNQYRVNIRGSEYTVIPSVHFSADLRSAGSYSSSIAKAFITAYRLVERKEVPCTAHVLNSTLEAICYLKSLLMDADKGLLEYVAYDLEWDSQLGVESIDEATRINALDLYNEERKIVAASFASSNNEGYCIPLYANGSKVDVDEVLPYLQEVLRSIPIICHNYTKAEGPYSQMKIGVRPWLHFDTMLASYVLFMKSSRHGLKPLAARWLGWPDWSSEVDEYLETLDPQERSFRNVPIELLGKYSAIDPAATYGLFEVFSDLIAKENLGYANELLTRAARVFCDIELRGAFVDNKYLEMMKSEYPVLANEALKKLLSYDEVKQYKAEKQEQMPRNKRTGEYLKSFEFNPMSSEHVGDLIYGKLGAPMNLSEDDRGRKSEVKQLMISCDLPAGSTSLPVSVVGLGDECKVMWLSNSDFSDGERVKVKEITNDGIVLKAPTVKDHRRPFLITLCNPITNENTTVNFIKLSTCEKCNGSGTIESGESESVCPGCEGSGGKPERRKLYQFLLDLRRYKKLTHIIDFYIDQIPKYVIPGTNQLVFNYLIHGTHTGRMSTKDFSLQTLPWHSDSRRIFISKWYNDGGLIASVDQSQLEMRVMAAVTGDENFIAIFFTCNKCEFVGSDSDKGKCPRCGGKLGGDLHSLVASMIWKKPVKEITKAQRRFAKTVAFGCCYARGPRSIAFETGLSLEEASELLDKFRSRFPKMTEWINEQHKQYDACGYVRTPIGRKLPLTGWKSGDRKLISKGKRESNNYPIQSSASDLTLEGLLAAHLALSKGGYNSRPWEFTHDSVEYDIYPGEMIEVLALAKREMEITPRQIHPWMVVPLVVDMEIGDRWDGGVSVVEFGNDYIRVQGRKGYYERLVQQLRKRHDVREEIVSEKYEPYVEGLVLRKSFEGIDLGGDYLIEAIVGLR